VVKSNVTVEEFAARRLGAITAPEEKPQEEQPIQEEPQAETPQEEAKPKKADDVLSKLELGELSDAELRELSEKLGSRAVARFGELTAKRKHAEEQIAALQAELASRNEVKKLEVKSEEPNPFAAIDNVEGLQAKAKEINEVIEWAEDQLDRADHLSFGDVAVVVDGKEMTKLQVKNALKNARKAKEQFLPAQLSELNARESRKQLKATFDEHARKELDWLSGEDNDTRKQYEAMMADKRLQKILEADPDVAPQIPYILAHAANSMYGRKLIPQTSTNPKLTPPSTPSSTAGQSSKPDARISKALEEAQNRYKTTGSISDYTALRALQLSRR